MLYICVLKGFISVHNGGVKDYDYNHLWGINYYCYCTSVTYLLLYTNILLSNYSAVLRENKNSFPMPKLYLTG